MTCFCAKLARLAGAICLIVTATFAHAATSDWVGDQRGAVRLITASDSVSGAGIDAGLEFRYPSGWHGYWRTPGDAGIAPVFDWSQSTNLTDPAVSWPAPTRLVVSGLQNSIYQGDFTLPVRFKVSNAHAPARIAVSLDYAACAEVCVPKHADLSLDLPVGMDAASAQANAINRAASAVPRSPTEAGIQVVRNVIDGTGAHRRLHVTLKSSTERFRSPDLFVEGAGEGLPPPPDVRLSDDATVVDLVASLPPDTPIAGHEELALTVVDGKRAVTFGGPQRLTVATQRADTGILAIIASALLGGLILNLMPCVLPILSIKLFGLAQYAGARRRTARLGATATALGIVTSFLIIAGGLSVLKFSGSTLGWGIQFQQPWFLSAMAALTVLFAASFFDWLPIQLPQRLLGSGELSARGPLAESFLGGVLATLLATPCSAPFVGTAVGFALAGSITDIFVIFACLGLGMALPFLAVAAVPALVTWLPRPGAWMRRLRQVLGLLLLGTAAWLLFTLWQVTDLAIASVVAGLLLAVLALRAFVTYRTPGKTVKWSGVFTIGLPSLTIVVASVFSSSTAAMKVDPGWRTFDPAAIKTLVASGNTVFVDVSASWCLTCKVNEITALKTEAVRNRLGQKGTVRMRADWSRPDPVIAAYIQHSGRFGIPLDVVYGPNEPSGKVLPEILSTALVIRALDDAGGTRLKR